MSTQELACIEIRQDGEENPWPFCLLCQKPVEEMHIRYGTRIQASTTIIGAEERVSTREEFLMIKCHGEEYEIARRRRSTVSGVLT